MPVLLFFRNASGGARLPRMGKFTNLALIAAATALIVVGVAAQTGTISMGGATSRGAVTGSHAVTPPKSPGPLQAALPSSLPTAASHQPVAAPPGGGGGDGGDGGD